jgi:FkbM family methyltransferase
MPVDRYRKELESLLREDMGSVLSRERNTFDELLAASGNRVVLFGAGNLGRKALSCLRNVGIEPLAFADNNPSRWGTKISDVPILSPQTSADEFGRSALFVVTIWCHGQTFRETRRQLAALGCVNVIPSAALRWKFSGDLLPDFCQDLPHKVYSEAAAVIEASCLWSDDLSRRQYLDQIRWRALGDYDNLNLAVIKEAYFLDNLFSLSTEEVFIDCGAYDGDTSRALIERQNGAFGRIVAIEPDPDNFCRLTSWIAKLDSHLAKKTVAFNIAIGSERKTVMFNATGMADASIIDSGSLSIQCRPLDELLTDYAPTFIKMDIEGAEPEAISGASQLIGRYRPILAVCVYHSQNHLWRVPLLLRSLWSDYEFFLRSHEVEGWESVCYAVPPERLLRPKGAGA